MVFLLVQTADHITGLTGVSPVVTLSKNGAAFGAAAGAVTEVGSGWYSLAGNATDRNTVGTLVLHATATGADPTDEKYTIVQYDPFLIFDSSNRADVGLWLGQAVQAAVNGFPKVDLTYVLGTILSESAGAGALAASIIKFFNKATPTGTINSIPDAVAGAANGIAILGSNMGTVTTAANLTNAPTNGDFTATMKTSLNAATPAVTVSDKTGFSLSVAGILAIWNQLTTDAGILASSFAKLIKDNLDAAISSRTKPSDTQARVTLVDTVTTYTGNTPQTGDNFARIGVAGVGLTNLGDARLAHLDADISSRMATFAYTAPLSAAGVRAAIGLATANLDTQLAAISGGTLTAAQIRAAVGLATANLDTQLAAILASESTPPSAATIAAAVWNAVLASFLTVGSTGAALNNVSGGGNGGTGTLVYTLTSSVGATPIEGARVELYSDIGLTALLEAGNTNVFGVVTFGNLLTGTYYLKIIRSGFETGFDTENVVE